MGKHPWGGILDIDDTLACTKHRRHYIEVEDPTQEDWDNFLDPEEVSDDPAVPGTEILEDLLGYFDEVYYLTGRPEDLRGVTTEWLADVFGQDVSDNLLMKPVPRSRGLAYKQKEIEKLLDKHPDAEFIFIDNEPENLEMMSAYGTTLQAPQIWGDIEEFLS